jgi:hypothetical protein
MAIALRGTATQGGHTNVPSGWTVSMPTGVVANDVIIVGVSHDNNNLPTITPPTGFVQVVNRAYSGNNRARMFIKKSDGSEGSSVFFGTSARADCSWSAIAYSGVDTTTQQDVAATSNDNGPGGGGTPTQTSQTTVTPGSMIVALWTAAAVSAPQFSSGPTPGGTVRKDYNFGSHYLMLVDYEKAAAGAVAMSVTTANSPIWSMGQIALRPATTTGQFARPSSDITDGLWTNESGSNVNLYASIDETVASDADYIQSALSPTSADIVTLRLSPIVDPGVNTAHTLRWRYKKDTTGGDQIDLTVRLLLSDGTTEVKSTVVTNIDAVTNGSFTLTGGEADSIPSADYFSGLVLKFEAIKP